MPQDRLPGYDPARDVVLDPRSLRALAHPLRLRLRGALIEHGPATASQLAALTGESSGATSYHLRQLAGFGFVVEEPGRGRGRERYWRAAHRSTWYDLAPRDADERAVGAEYLRAVGRVYAERIVRFADSFEAASDALGGEWADVSTMSDWVLDLDPDQARRLATAFHELCLPFRHEPGAASPSGSRRVVVQFQLLASAATSPASQPAETTPHSDPLDRATPPPRRHRSPTPPPARRRRRS